MSNLYEAIATEPYEQRGIIHSEAALIVHTCLRVGIERIVESGRARAQSTYMLAKYLPHVEIHSIELRENDDADFGRKRVGEFANVTLHDGDGAILIPEIVSQSGVPTAVLCDGPKGHSAIEIVSRCLAYRHVLVGFIHDMRRLDHGEPSPYRLSAEERFEIHRFSDDPVLVNGTSWMDAVVLEAGGPCGPQFEAQYGSYGPTIGAFFNPQQ